jgi:hypothetical protein
MNAKEGASFKLTVKFADEAGAPVVPLEIKYRIDCVNDGAAVKAVATITPAAEVEIDIRAGDTRVMNPLLPYEQHEVTVVAKLSEDGSRQIVDSFIFGVKNFKFHTQAAP